MLKGLGRGTMALALASKVQALALRDEALALRFWPRLHHCYVSLAKELKIDYLDFYIHESNVQVRSQPSDNGGSFSLDFGPFSGRGCPGETSIFKRLTLL